jgi:hypothetical protein
MPLNSDNIIQFKVGSSTGTATPTLDAPTTAGNLLIIVGFTAKNDGVNISGYDFPTGSGGTFLELNSGYPGGDFRFGRIRIAGVRDVPSGESSWTMTQSNGPTLGLWIALEMTGVGLNPGPVIATDPWFVAGGSGTASSTTTAVASDTTPFVPELANTVIDCFDSLGFAVFGANNQVDTTIPTIAGYTDLWYEVVQTGVADGTHGLALSIAARQIVDLARYSVTASVSPSSNMTDDLAIFYADGGKFSPKLDTMCGFEFGTATGITSGSAVVTGTAPWDGSTGTPEVVTTHPRTGLYGLKLSSAAAAENITWTSAGALGVYYPYGGANWNMIARFHVYFETSLPGADVELASVEAGSLANGVVIWYRSATQKIGVIIGTGTEQTSDAVIAADKHIGIDFRYKSTMSTTHTCDWQVDYDSLDVSAAPVAQTQATATSMTWEAPTTFRLGWTTSKTATVYYDDVFVSKQWGSYPLGDMRIEGKKVDPAGTPAVTGTSTNFQSYASNGTGTAFNAATVRAAIDEMPPTIGASADGLMQVSVAASDYVTIPMDTFTAAPDNCLRAVRWYLAGWSNGGNPATLRVVSNDGSNDVFDVAVGDHGFDDTTLRWLCGMQRRKIAGYAGNHYQITQALMDALAVRVGYSTDATPDVGVHAVLAEVAYTPAVAEQIASGDDGTFTLYAKQDPLTGALKALVATTPPGTRGATVTWTKNSVDSSQYVAANDLQTISIGADTTGDVTALGFAPDPSV